MKNRDIIIIGNQNFYLDPEEKDNSISIAKELAKRNRVFFVCPPLNRKISQTQVSKKKGLIKDSRNLWFFKPRTTLYSINGIIFKLFNFLIKKNTIRFVKEILAEINNLKISDFIIIDDNHLFRSTYLKELLKPSLYIYYLKSNLSYISNKETKVSKTEIALLKQVDIILTNHKYMVDVVRTYNKNTYHIRQACDSNLYSHEVFRIVPKELGSLLTPIIGYIGVLDSDILDIDLIEYLAVNNPLWTFLFIGSQKKNFCNSRLYRYKNISFIENKKPEELPDYIQFFDIAIHPQRVNNFITENYQKRITEYLAMGKHVITTNTVVIQEFKDMVYISNSHDQFLHNIELALKSDNQDEKIKRRNFAKKNSWSESANIIYRCVDEYKLNS
ncbi:MAG: hypothetical protein ACEPOV_01630 [Hyphomicrobiales bacterium]